MKTILLILIMTVSSSLIAADQTTGGPSKTKKVGTLFQEGLKAYEARKQVEAIKLFKQLVDKRWEELSLKGKHGAATLLMVNLVFAGKLNEATEYGQILFRKAPGMFTRLSELSNVPANAEISSIRRSIFYISLQTMKGNGIIYIHNASDENLAISNTEFDVVYGYKSKTFSCGKLANKKTKPAFPVSPLILNSESGKILISGKETRNSLLPIADMITLLACVDRDRTPEWIHLTGGLYTQKLTSLQLRATVKWGRAIYNNILLIDKVPGK